MVGATNASLLERPVALAPGEGDPLPHQTTNRHVPRDCVIPCIKIPMTMHPLAIEEE